MIKIFFKISPIFLTFLTLTAYTQTGWYLLPGLSGNEYCEAMSFINNYTGYISTSGSGILKTTNGGMNWVTLYTGYSMDVYSVSFANELTGYVSGSSGKVIKTDNGGINWLLCYEDNSFYMWDILFINSETGWLAAGPVYPKILKTTNGGLNWVTQLSVSSGEFRSVFFINDLTGWAAGSGVYRTTDGGTNWVNVLQAGNGDFFDIHFVNSANGWVISNQGKKIFRSVNGGLTWLNVFTFNISPKRIYGVTNDTLYAGLTSNGTIMKSNNGGTNWFTQINYSSTSSLNGLYFFNPLTGYACGTNGLVLKTTNGGLTYINKTSTNIPEKFELFQNYPNPFNPVTDIEFSLSQTVNVNLTVFDVLGRAITTLVNREMKPGNYNIEFKGMDFPSGIYYYTLLVYNNSVIFKETKKMILLR